MSVRANLERRNHHFWITSLIVAGKIEQKRFHYVMHDVGQDSSLRLQFGQAVRRRRVALGFTQEELASRAELHRTYITDIERGTRNPTLETMWSIASALDTSLSSLLVFPKSSSAPSKNI